MSTLLRQLRVEEARCEKLELCCRNNWICSDSLEMLSQLMIVFRAEYRSRGLKINCLMKSTASTASLMTKMQWSVLAPMAECFVLLHSSL